MYRAEYDNPNAEFITVKQGSNLTNLSITTVRKLAEESGALRKIGRCCRINKRVFLNFVDSKYPQRRK